MKLHKVLFWVLVFFLPTQLGRHFWPQFSFVFGLRVDYLAPTVYFTDLLVFGVLAAWLFEKIKNKQSLLLRNQKSKIKFTTQNLKLFCFLFSVFCFLFLSSFLAQNPQAALYKLARLAEMFFLGFYVAKNAQWLNGLMAKLLSLGIIYESFIAWFQFFKQSSVSGFFWYLGERSFSAGTPGIALAELGGKIWLRPYGTFSHPNSLAGFLLVALFLIWYLSKNLSSWTRAIVLILGVSTIILSFSRAIWLVGLWLMAYTLCFNFIHLLKKKMIRLNFTFYFLLFTLIVALGAFFSLAPRLSGQEAVVQRLELTRVAILMFQGNPLSGVGLNNFIVLLPQFYREGLTFLLQPVHNIFLLVAVETGLIGFLVFLWFLWLTVKRLIFKKESFLLLALGAILLTGIFDHYWLTLQQNQLLAAIVFGLSWSRIKA